MAAAARPDVAARGPGEVVARRPPRWLLAALVAALLPAVLMPPSMHLTADSWWPAVGLVAALALLLPRARQLPVLVGATAFSALGVWLLYRGDPVLVSLAALAVTGAGVGTATLLRPPDGRPERPVIADFGGLRYHLVLLVASLACGVVMGLLGLVAVGPAQGLAWLVLSTLGALTSLLTVLPLTMCGDPQLGAGRPAERWVQRGALLVTLGLVPLLGVVFVLTFPLLAWAGLRASRREALLQLFAVSAAVYVLSLGGLGPLSPERQVDLVPDPVETLPLYLVLAALAYLVVPLTTTVERLARTGTRAEHTATRLQRTLEAANDTMLILSDGDRRITHYSTGAHRILGYAAEEVLGRTGAMFHSEADLARVGAELGVVPTHEAVVREQVRRGVRVEHELVCKDGTRRIVSVSISAVTDDHGEVFGLLACGEDVTERLRAQRALEAALEREHQSVLRLQEVDHVKQELVSNVSHELRTPITSIAGYAELLADSSLGELSRPQRDALARIERNALRLQTLVDDLLTLSRSEAGRLQLARDCLDLGQVTRGAWELFEEQLRHRELQATLALPAAPVRVLGDRDALERVVVNLVSNAVKFTPDGGEVAVTVSRAATGRALLVVRDTGIGISAEDQEQLFTRFFRATGATESAIQGTGLGLSIVQALVSQHGGQVAVRSRPGEGTRVSVELPSA